MATKVILEFDGRNSAARSIIKKRGYNMVLLEETIQIYNPNWGSTTF